MTEQPNLTVAYTDGGVILETHTGRWILTAEYALTLSVQLACAAKALVEHQELVAAVDAITKPASDDSP